MPEALTARAVLGSIQGAKTNPTDGEGTKVVLAPAIVPDTPKVALAPAIAPDTPAVRRPRRRNITNEEFAHLATGKGLSQNEVYVGRGGRGVSPSKWGNPYRLKQGYSRDEALKVYKLHLGTAGLKGEVAVLIGQDLFCHSPPGVACHADVLLAAAAAAGEKMEELKVDDGHADALPVPSELLVDDGLPVWIVAILEVEGERAPPLPSAVGWHGLGPPRMARHMGGDKPYCDGGGLCSPARWRPCKRRLPAALSGLRPRIGGLFGKAEAEKPTGLMMDDGPPVRDAGIPEVGEGCTTSSTTAGWHGLGPPRVARHMGGDRPYHDGGGLCSPGRWPPNRRRLPSALPDLRGQLRCSSTRPSRQLPGDATIPSGSR